MAASTEFTAYILELLEPLNELTSSRFFGGIGIKNRSKLFAMIMGNTLYFCVNDDTRKNYQAKGMMPFSYSTKKGRVEVARYYSVPEDLLEDREQLLVWAREAIDAAYKA